MQIEEIICVFSTGPGLMLSIPALNITQIVFYELNLGLQVVELFPRLVKKGNHHFPEYFIVQLPLFNFFQTITLHHHMPEFAGKAFEAIPQSARLTGAKLGVV